MEPLKKFIIYTQLFPLTPSLSGHIFLPATIDGYCLKTAYNHNARVLLKVPLDCTWGFVPGCFNPKINMIHVRHLMTKYRQFRTPKTKSNILRHTSNFCTSLQISWTFLDILSLKLTKCLLYNII